MNSCLLFLKEIMKLLLPSSTTEDLLSLKLRKQTKKYFYKGFFIRLLVLLQLQLDLSHIQTLTHHLRTDFPHMLLLLLVVGTFINDNLLHLDFLQRFITIVN
jgi:hypothetical protein